LWNAFTSESTLFAIVEMVWALTGSPNKGERASVHRRVETPKTKTFYKASSTSGILCIEREKPGSGSLLISPGSLSVQDSYP